MVTITYLLGAAPVGADLADGSWAMMLFYLLLALGVSFLCSLLEASLLSVPQTYVAAMVERGSAAGRVIQGMRADIDRPLAAILTLNTIAHTVGAAGAGAQAAAIFGSQWLGLASAILTLLILVLSEIIPKTLGSVHARGLAGFTARTVQVLIVLVYPLVLACEWVSQIAGGRAAQRKLERAEVHSIATVGQEEGALTAAESQMIRNLLALPGIRVEQVMTPRSVVFALPHDRTVAEVINSGEPLRFARIPIIGENMDDMRGLVHRYRIFQAHRAGKGPQTMAELASPIHAVPENASLADLIDQFVQRKEQLFQVVDEYGGTEGIVTMEDALETLLGVEIVDETDAVEDMRRLARRLLLQRQRALAHEPQGQATSPDVRSGADSDR